MVIVVCMVKIMGQYERSIIPFAVTNTGMYYNSCLNLHITFNCSFFYSCLNPFEINLFLCYIAYVRGVGLLEFRVCFLGLNQVV
jgi:hypothetical protein